MHTNIELSDGGIALCAPKSSNADEIHAAVRESLAELIPWMDWATASYDEDSARRWLGDIQLAWEHASAYHFAIMDALNGEFLGVCGLDGIDAQKGVCNMGYWVRTQRARQGIASRAAQLAAGFAFETLKLSRIEILIAAPNIASQRTAQKIGARYEATLPEGMVVHTDVYDAVKYVLTLDGWRISKSN